MGSPTKKDGKKDAVPAWAQQPFQKQITRNQALIGKLLEDNTLVRVLRGWHGGVHSPSGSALRFFPSAAAGAGSSICCCAFESSPNFLVSSCFMVASSSSWRFFSATVASRFFRF